MNVDSNREVNLEIFLDVNKGYISAEKNKDNEIKIFDETDSTVLIYEEKPAKFVGSNLLYRDTLEYWTLNPSGIISTDIIDGFQVEIDPAVETAEYDYETSDQSDFLMDVLSPHVNSKGEGGSWM